MYRNSSLFAGEAVVIGIITGITAMAFNESALVTDFGQVIVHPAITFGAAIMLSVVGIFSRPLTQTRGGCLVTSWIIGSTIGIILVSSYWHLGYGILCLIPITAAYCGRKLYYDHRHGFQPTSK